MVEGKVVLVDGVVEKADQAAGLGKRLSGTGYWMPGRSKGRAKQDWQHTIWFKAAEYTRKKNSDAKGVMANGPDEIEQRSGQERPVGYDTCRGEGFRRIEYPNQEVIAFIQRNTKEKTRGRRPDYRAGVAEV